MLKLQDRFPVELRLHRFILCTKRSGGTAKASTAPGLGVYKWSPEGLHDKSVSLIPNTDEILIIEEKNELIGVRFVDTQAWSCRMPWYCP